MKTVSIANQKGGCGKTTTAINLSGAIAGTGRRILLVDLDPQAHASYGLGVTNQVVDKTIYNVLTDNADKRRPISECILNIAQNLDIVTSNILLSTLEQELKDKEDAVSRLHQVLSESDLGYDYVVVDCPPSLGFLTFNALRAADQILVPIDMSAFSLMGVGKLLGMLELIKIKINHAPRVNGLATIYDKRTKYSQTMLEEIRAFFKDQMLSTVIRMSVSLKKAAAKGITAMQFDAKSNGAADYLALAEELLRIDGAYALEKAMAEEPAVQASPDREILNQPRITEEQPLPISPRIEAQPSLPLGPREILFKYNGMNARDVYLVGDFNHWKINDESRLSRAENGQWEKKINLPEGRYKYKFVVDGEWLVDSENQEREPNSFGTLDSIIKL